MDHEGKDGWRDGSTDSEVLCPSARTSDLPKSQFELCSFPESSLQKISFAKSHQGVFSDPETSQAFIHPAIMSKRKKSNRKRQRGASSAMEVSAEDAFVDDLQKKSIHGKQTDAAGDLDSQRKTKKAKLMRQEEEEKEDQIMSVGGDAPQAKKKKQSKAKKSKTKASGEGKPKIDLGRCVSGQEVITS